MWIRQALTIAVAIKLFVRAAIGKGPFIDIGDLILMLLLYVFVPPGSGAFADLAYHLPAGKYCAASALLFAALFIFGRALSRFTGLDDAKGQRGIRQGGVAGSLIGLKGWCAFVLPVPFCIPGAFLEELLFRGALFALLAVRFGKAAACFLQAATFAAVHAVPAGILKHGSGVVTYAAMFPLVSGIALQGLTEASSSIVAPALVHAALNVASAWRAKLSADEGIR